MADAGKISFVFRGEYKAANFYELLDVVLYKGSLYTPKKYTTGNAPGEDTEFWQLYLPGINPDDFVTSDRIGQPEGVASLGENGKVPTSQLPTMNYVSKTEKGTANGVATLDNTGKVPLEQIPDDISVEEMTGATEDEDGESGTVPKPLAGEQDRFLRVDGTWANVKQITVDDELSTESENPVQNKVVTDAIEKAAMISNPNLLDNAWFHLNSRGKILYDGENNGYAVDRWKRHSDEFSVTVNDDHTVTLTEKINNPHTSFIFQYLDIITDRDLTVTFSVIAKGKFGLAYYGREWEDTVYNTEDFELKSITYTIPKGTDLKKLQFLPLVGIPRIYTVGDECTIKAAKLELGSVSTLHLDSAPDKTLEYIKCITSTADPNDIYANKPINMASNRNLLDNPWFTVNQRGGKITLKGTSVYIDPDCTNLAGPQYEEALAVTRTNNGNYYTFTTGPCYFKPSDVVDGYCEQGYTFDRWLFTEGNTEVVRKNADGSLSVSLGNNATLFQLFPPELCKSLLGKVVTFSAIINDTLYQSTITVPSYLPPDWESYGSISIGGTMIMRFLLYRDGLGQVAFWNNSLNRSDFIIKAAKLELGSVSTLHLDTVPDYTTELHKCQRYYKYFKQLNCFRNISGSWYYSVEDNKSLPMRVSPSIEKFSPDRVYMAVALGRSDFGVKIVTQVGDGKGNMFYFQILDENGNNLPSDINSLLVYDIAFSADL